MKLNTTHLCFSAALAALSFVATATAQQTLSTSAEPAWRIARGVEVMENLGSRLPGVAQLHGVSTNELQTLICRDKSIATDKDANLFYACPPPSTGTRITRTFDTGAAATTGTTTTTSSATLYPAEQTFLLHSRPASTKKIYLDFTGHTTIGTSWNASYTAGAAFTTPAFDLDGNTATAFTTAELARIQLIWTRVVEDYVAFDVDVTTEEPSLDGLSRTNSADTTYGIRVCIGGNSTDWFKASAGGIAYIGSFKWNSDTPCYVFAKQLSSNEKYLADAASHEVGHTLGLYHDGVLASATTTATEYYQGQGNWAPIMGTGYSKSITQWSKGEYANANNTQDDLAVMQTYGVALRADDHGNTTVNATTLTGTSPTASGVISTRTDADVFKFSTGAGSISFNAATAAPDADLDIQLAIYDGAGNLVTSANTTSLSCTLTATLAAGTYYLAVDGVGASDSTTSYSDYASIGQYFLTGSLIVQTNKAPIVAAAASVLTGTAPFSVTFSSAGTYDTDGSISSYNWDFGDSSAQATVATPAYVYTTPGTYTASLVAFDNGGLSASATVTIVVTAPAVSVAKIAMIAKASNGSSNALATVTVKSSTGAAVAGVKVSGTWSGIMGGSFTFTTNSLGQVTFLAPRVSSIGTATFTVTNATATDYSYAAEQNVETSKSIAVK